MIGVDPGAGGGVAMLSDSGEFLGGIRMPVLQATPKVKVVDLSALDQWMRDTRPVGTSGVLKGCVIEQVSAMPRQGVSSAFSFGRVTGAVEAWAAAMGRTHWVTPAVWKKALNLTSDKQASLDKARLEFGRSDLWTVKANDGIAEAALIALYWQRKEMNR
jgi:crossover junction endodeoxyribonuclease RuvC